MYTERALNQIKNLWNKDEETFRYCMDMLKDKLTGGEYHQLLFYYYYVNDKFETAAGYVKDLVQSDRIRQGIQFMSDDDIGDLCACTACCCLDECGNECCDCCTGCGGAGCSTCCFAYCIIASFVSCCECCGGGCMGSCN